jgi:eukaryotic-like serine/threonine-protein kinase
MTVLADRYELAEELGAGGMARVVAAYDRSLDRRVAIKLIREELLGDATVRDRLLREARAAARLHHPNTVAVYDVGEDDGRGFVVMELVRGTTLAQHLAAGPLRPEPAVRIITAVLDGLQAAHARGLVHRDVKPSNILLPAEGGVKLADFGIARGMAEATSKLTATGTVLGTPAYLAPEVIGGADAAPTSDLYAVGIVLYEALAGRVPFAAESPIAVALAHQRTPPPPLTDLAPSVSPSLVEAVERALAKDPADRFTDAAAMRTALVESLRDTSTSPPAGVAPAAVAPAAVAPAAVAPVTVPLAPADDVGDLRAGAAEGASGDVPDDDETMDGEVAELGGPRWQRPAVVVAVLVAAALLGLVLDLGGQRADDGGPADDGTDETVTPGDDSGTETGDDTGDADPPVDPDEADADPGRPEEPGRPDEPGPPAGDGADGPTDTDVPLEELDSLIGRIDDDPDRYGEGADELRAELQSIRAATDAVERARDARELVVDVALLLRDDELSRSPGRELIDVLDPIGRPAIATLHELHDVFVAIGRDPDRFGDRADDVLDDLEDLLDNSDAEDWRDDAAALLQDLEVWVDDGDVRRPETRDLSSALEDLIG